MTEKRGRKPKLGQPERVSKLLTALKNGHTRRAAAASVGISADTLQRMVKQSAAFAAQVEHSESLAEAEHTLVLFKAAHGYEVVKETKFTKSYMVNGVIQYATETRTERYETFDWRAALAWLSRRRPQEWSEHRQVTAEAEQPLTYRVVYPEVLAGQPTG
jgi:hypothetical protein